MLPTPWLTERHGYDPTYDGTRWSSAFADPQWIKIDLGSAQTFDRVVLQWQDSFAVDYQIQVSNDGSDDDSSWTPVYTETGGKGGTEDVRFKATTARYVRMHGTKRATQFGYSLFEFGVYNTANTPQFAITATSTGSGTIAPAGTTQVLQGGPVTYTFTPADGNAVTAVQVDGQNVGLVSSYTFNDVLMPHTVNVTFGPSAGAVNLALGAKATASGLENDGYPASNAVDGNLNTRWSSAFVDPSWITLDFGTQRTFNRVMLFWENAHSVKYQIQTSNDGNNWTPVFTQDDGKGGVEDISFATVTARYVRMNSTQRSSDYGNSLFEFEVFNMPTTGDAGGSTGSSTGGATDAGTGTNTGSNTGTNTGGSTGSNTGSNNTNPVQASNGNLALGKLATASGTQGDGYPASAAVDGDPNSRWSSDFNDNAWLEVDLGQAQLFNRIVLRWENAYGSAYQLQASNDGNNWTPVFTQNAGKGGTEDLTVPATTARYVRMQGVKRASQFGYSLFEFEVYNNATTPKVAITASGDANGTLSPSGTVNIDAGATQTFTAVPAQGYGVGAMFVDGQEVGVQSTYTFTNVTGSHTISVNFVPQAASVNLALHRTATASSLENDGLPASAAVDGDLTTRFSSGFSDPQWLEVDLGTAQTFDRAVINWQDAHATAYQIQTSSDNQNWTPVFTQNEGKGGVEDLKFAAATARYVRINMTQRSTQYGDSIFEFQLYNSGATTSAPVAAFIEQPASQTVPVGQNGHFAVLPSGNGPFTYQWRRNATPIANATSRTYDTPVTAAGDSGAVYSVVVTGPNGPVTSNDATLTVNSAFPNYTVTPGFVSVDLANNTNGAYPDDKVYVLVIARDPATGQFAWLKPDGTIVASAVSDNDAPNHLTGPDGQNYANYAFTLAQSKTLQLPKLFSGRIYVSLGTPVYLKILTDANNQIGFAGPNPQNPTDPNLNVIFDWYEFTYNDSGLWLNTTQVDEFGFPLTEDVYGSNHTFHQQTGITQRRADLFAAYASEVSSAFQPQPASQFRIMAPAKGSFAAGQPNGNYFDAYVKEVWTYYSSNSLVLNMFGNSRQFVGKVQGDQLVFSETNLNNGAFVGGTYVVNKPTTQDVLQGSGALATGNSTELAIEAQLCAALNRHVAEDVSKWANPAAWYAASPSNEYARFFHDHGISGLDYGFAYDDVNDASSTIVAPQPEHVVLGIGF
ncbi:discoidin domain-containing protein [Paraburkholderia sp. SARCC-3016]|uniref:galactose-binding domain-containing protein n=1 Tax=Paraburkholderia sp. SARCC-3016 TaxID=3058611 RepID=UPI00280A2C0B|nr:discoidin domain-containing protein [Paraburkholderia sp. SARCC-3016]MDQ7980572.1 discoidin domain-containing protein [Paraburkholderia sp. SARCC-3016]